MNSVILLVLLGIVAWFWFDTLRSQEIAKAICKQVCKQLHLQLLDDTITLVRVRLRRNNRGRFRVQRTYQFEFSDGSNNRQQGMMIMRGTALEILELPGYTNRIISPV
ncbi:MAG: DUF3301 domain-containing protein [Candidatus Parabeggiatoa sp. nov. 2]|nr:MAG: hypothetical protein B6247_16055 [Beggiatoa sp. 4572_84]RKZ60296.1 MAG: DUF3301 domain-containing protein [Gammaproteobacteria bacterium]